MTSQENVQALADMTARAKEVLGSIEAAERWLNELQPTLGGVTPLSLLDTEEGARMVYNILGRIEHGVFS